MRQRADEHGVAEVKWMDMDNADGSHIGMASGVCVCAHSMHVCLHIHVNKAASPQQPNHLTLNRHHT